MRADIREMELCFYNFKSETKDKKMSDKMKMLIADLETHLQLMITQSEKEWELNNENS